MCFKCFKGVRPKYKLVILDIYPDEDSSAPLDAPVSHKLSDLTQYAVSWPGKLKKMGRYLLKRVQADLARGYLGNARLGMLAFEALMKSCHDELNLYDAFVTEAIALLFEHEEPVLKVAAANAFFKLLYYQDDDDFAKSERFIPQLTQHCHYRGKMVEDTQLVRKAALRVLAQVVRTNEVYRTAAHFDKIVPAVLANMSNNFEHLEGDMADLNLADRETSEAKGLTVEMLAYACLASVVAVPTTHMRNLLGSVFAQLDRYAWLPETFSKQCMRMVANRSELESGDFIVMQLLSHMRDVSTEAVKSRMKRRGRLVHDFVTADPPEDEVAEDDEEEEEEDDEAKQSETGDEVRAEQPEQPKPHKAKRPMGEQQHTEEIKWEDRDAMVPEMQARILAVSSDLVRTMSLMLDAWRGPLQLLFHNLQGAPERLGNEEWAELERCAVQFVRAIALKVPTDADVLEIVRFVSNEALFTIGGGDFEGDGATVDRSQELRHVQYSAVLAVAEVRRKLRKDFVVRDPVVHQIVSNIYNERLASWRVLLFDAMANLMLPPSVCTAPIPEQSPGPQDSKLRNSKLFRFMHLFAAHGGDRNSMLDARLSITTQEQRLNLLSVVYRELTNTAATEHSCMAAFRVLLIMLYMHPREQLTAAVPMIITLSKWAADTEAGGTPDKRRAAGYGRTAVAAYLLFLARVFTMEDNDEVRLCATQLEDTLRSKIQACAAADGEEREEEDAEHDKLALFTFELQRFCSADFGTPHAVNVDPEHCLDALCQLTREATPDKLRDKYQPIELGSDAALGPSLSREPSIVDHGSLFGNESSYTEPEYSDMEDGEVSRMSSINISTGGSIGGGAGGGSSAGSAGGGSSNNASKASPAHRGPGFSFDDVAQHVAVAEMTGSAKFNRFLAQNLELGQRSDEEHAAAAAASGGGVELTELNGANGNGAADGGQDKQQQEQATEQDAFPVDTDDAFVDYDEELDADDAYAYEDDDDSDPYAGVEQSTLKQQFPPVKSFSTFQSREDLSSMS